MENINEVPKNKSKAKIGLIIGVVVALAVSGILVYLLFGGRDGLTPNDPNINTEVSEDLSMVEANNRFGFDLYDKYKLEEGNVFFSPYSISTALAMTYEGARGETAEEIKEVFYFPEIDKMRQSSAYLYNQLNAEGKEYKLSTANALWAEQTYTFLDDYLGTINSYYDGQVTNLDFKNNPEDSRITINEWVEDKTNDRIKDLIPAGLILPDTRLVLTNAVYFKANWSKQFDAENTIDGKFKLSSGISVDSRMMYQTENFNYGENDKLQILEMDYLGNELSMLIILPKNNMDEIQNEITLENLESWKEEMNIEKVEVSLPKFKFETKYFMGDTLKEMGMPTAFKWPDADFSGMDGTRNLYIGQVIHQTFVEVAEYGTEAAAATAVIMKVGASPQQEQPKIFKADHPFIFLIQDKQTGNILFLGRVSNPL